MDLDSKTKEIVAFTTDDLDLKTTFKYSQKEYFEDVLQKIRTTVENKGGICG